jgi:hypothetical protein
MTGPVSSLTPPPAPDLRAGIQAAARDTGVPFEFLMAVAERESGGRVDAKARSSTATGAFQFIEDTWLRVVDRYGAAHGLSATADAIATGTSGRPVVRDAARRADILALRTDPELSARMAAELARENGRMLEASLGRAVTPDELYLAHVFGPARAGQLIEAATTAPDDRASRHFAREAAANPGLFQVRLEDGTRRDRTLAELVERLALPAAEGEAEAPDRTLTDYGAGEATPTVDRAQMLAQAAAHIPTLTHTASGDSMLAPGVLWALLDLQQASLAQVTADEAKVAKQRRSVNES